MRAAKAVQIVREQSGVKWEDLAELTNTKGGRQGIHDRVCRAKSLGIVLFTELCGLMGCEVVVRPRKEFACDFELIIDDGVHRDHRNDPEVAFIRNCPDDIYDEPLEELPQPTYQPKSTDPLEPFLARARAESKAEREADLSLIKPDW